MSNLSVLLSIALVSATVAACSGSLASVMDTPAAAESPGSSAGPSGGCRQDGSIDRHGAAFDGGSGDGGEHVDGDSTPICADALKRCPRELSFAPQIDPGVATTVEVRGDWDGTASWQTGAPMAPIRGAWKTTINVPYDKPVHYKFLVNGSSWVTDPGKPVAPDPTGNLNNVLSAVQCNDPTCSPAPMK